MLANRARKNYQILISRAVLARVNGASGRAKGWVGEKVRAVGNQPGHPQERGTEETIRPDDETCNYKRALNTHWPKFTASYSSAMRGPSHIESRASLVPWDRNRDLPA